MLHAELVNSLIISRLPFIIFSWERGIINTKMARIKRRIDTIAGIMIFRYIFPMAKLI
jgi:hypothetical protein